MSVVGFELAAVAQSRLLSLSLTFFTRSPRRSRFSHRAVRWVPSGCPACGSSIACAARIDAASDHGLAAPAPEAGAEAGPRGARRRGRVPPKPLLPPMASEAAAASCEDGQPLTLSLNKLADVTTALIALLLASHLCLHCGLHVLSALLVALVIAGCATVTAMCFPQPEAGRSDGPFASRFVFGAVATAYLACFAHRFYDHSPWRGDGLLWSATCAASAVTSAATSGMGEEEVGGGGLGAGQVQHADCAAAPLVDRLLRWRAGLVLVVAVVGNLHIISGTARSPWAVARFTGLVHGMLDAALVAFKVVPISVCNHERVDSQGLGSLAEAIVSSLMIASALLATPANRHRIHCRYGRYLKESELARTQQMPPTPMMHAVRLTDPDDAEDSDDRETPDAAMPEGGGSGGGDMAAEVCVVCMDSPMDHAFIECGHICACRGCAHAIMASTERCPICRARASSVLKTYRVSAPGGTIRP